MNKSEPLRKTESKYAAAPLSRNDIAAAALWLRKRAGLEDVVQFNIVRFIENVLPSIHPNFQFEIVENWELDERYAETIPAFGDQPAIIRVRESVYTAAVNGVTRAIFTLAHEVGHLLFHTPRRMILCRIESSLPAFRDPEWQANTFAGEFLVMRHLACGMSPFEIADKFHVSYSVAEIQAKYCKN